MSQGSVAKRRAVFEQFHDKAALSMRAAPAPRGGSGGGGVVGSVAVAARGGHPAPHQQGDAPISMGLSPAHLEDSSSLRSRAKSTPQGPTALLRPSPAPTTSSQKPRAQQSPAGLFSQAQLKACLAKLSPPHQGGNSPSSQPASAPAADAVAPTRPRRPAPVDSAATAGLAKAFWGVRTRAQTTAARPSATPPAPRTTAVAGKQVSPGAKSRPVPPNDPSGVVCGSILQTRSRTESASAKQAREAQVRSDLQLATDLQKQEEHDQVRRFSRRQDTLKDQSMSSKSPCGSSASVPRPASPPWSCPLYWPPPARSAAVGSASVPAGHSVVKLNLESAEAVKVERAFRSGVQGIPGTTFSVTGISLVVNLRHWRMFCTTRSMMGQEGELWAWHGTKSSSVPKVCRGGFDRDFSKVAIYGKGTYFSTSTSYNAPTSTYCPADSDGRCFLLYCRLSPGRITTHDGKEDRGAYDSFVNRTNDPTIYVATKDFQAYPEFIVEFQRSQN